MSDDTPRDLATIAVIDAALGAAMAQAITVVVAQRSDNSVPEQITDERFLNAMRSYISARNLAVAALRKKTLPGLI